MQSSDEASGRLPCALLLDLLVFQQQPATFPFRESRGTHDGRLSNAAESDHTLA